MHTNTGHAIAPCLKECRMRTRHTNSYRVVAVVAVWSLLVPPPAVRAAWLQTAPAKPTSSTTAAQPAAKPAPKPAASTTAATDPRDEWPHYHIAADGSQVVVYQPQIASWDNQ